MKISVVGAGNAGCFTALNFGWTTRKNKDIEVELIHDPNKNSERVGQATLPDALILLHNSMRFDWYNNFMHATPKAGILYEGWGKRDKWFHGFPRNQMAMHYCPWEMQKTVLESGHFKVKEGNVDPKDVDADYVFDCRGKPDDESQYENLTNPINACILGKPNFDTTDALWSRHVATPDGWTFVIPTNSSSPSHDYCVGYLYNNKITTKEIAEYNMLEMFDVEVTKHITFKSYVAKNPIEDGRIFKNGNRLFFLEPLESTSLEAYLSWTREIIDFFNGVKTLEQCGDNIRKHLFQCQNFVLWHYQFKSKYNTPFWDYAESISHFEDQEFDDMLANIYTRGDEKYLNYSQWGKWNFRNWHKGMIAK